MTTEILYAEVASADHGRSGVSWGSVIGGALATISLSIILVSLASGLGLMSVSVYGPHNGSGANYAISAALALVVIQWLSAAFGGYIAGRTRARWSGLHTHESGFRDTAHGFLSWALATVLTVGLLAMAGGSALSNAAHGAATLGAAGAVGAGMAARNASSEGVGSADQMAIFTDRLFRNEGPVPTTGTTTATTGTLPTNITVPTTPEMRAEAGRLLLTQFADGGMSDTDRAYLAQEVARVTGLPPDEAQKRVADVSSAVTEVSAKAKAAAEAARKAAAAGAIFTALSLLIGAFIGGVAGAVGGHRRELNAAVRPS